MQCIRVVNHEISHERINLNMMTYFKIRNLDIKGKTRRKSLSILHVVCKNNAQMIDSWSMKKVRIQPESEENGSCRILVKLFVSKCSYSSYILPLQVWFC